MARTPDNDTLDSVSADLSAWLDGELSDDRAAELEALLEHDLDLKAELGKLETAVAFTRATAPAAAPPDFTARLMDRLAREEDRHPAQARWRRPLGVPLEGWAVGLAAAAAVLLLVLPERSGEPGGGAGEQTWSPAAMEGPPSLKGVPPELLVPPQQKTAEPLGTRTRVVGSGRTLGAGGAAPPPEAPTVAPDGTVAAGDGGASGPGPAEPPPFEGRPASVVYAVHSEDPELKRKVLATVARYGEVMTADGLPVASAAMAAPTERMRISLQQDQLAAFNQDLVESGFLVQHWVTGELASGDRVQIDVVLELTAAEAP
jgi:anti-sigma factor RsiW